MKEWSFSGWRPRSRPLSGLPEPVNSVVVGDPENFQAEHSEREPELVTVKPITDHPAQTNLLITTTLGHQINLLLLSPGELKAGSQAVDVLLTYGKPKSGSFLVEESASSTSLVAETTKLGTETKPVTTAGAQASPSVTQSVSLLKTGSTEAPRPADDASGEALATLLERHPREPFPTLYGQKPREI